MGRIFKHLVRLIGEFFVFAWENKAWWIVPIILVLLLLTALIFATEASLPFMYTLF